MEDTELLATYMKAIKDYKSLPDLERLRFSLFMGRAFRVLEQQFLHTKRSSIDIDYFESINTSFTEALTFPGVLQWWETSGDSFGERRKNDAIRRDRVDGRESDFPPADPGIFATLARIAGNRGNRV